MNEQIKNSIIPEEIKNICRSCESNLFAQNKGCAFRSLGNEYCDYVLEATQKILGLETENKKLWERHNEEYKIIANLHFIIKEVREYIEDTPKIVKSIHLRNKESNFAFIENEVKNELLEILDKVD